MNKWIIAIGSILITSFFVVFFFQLQKSRLNVIQQNTNSKTTTVNTTLENLDPVVNKNAKQETQILQIQRRGSIVSVDPTEKVVTLVNYDPRGLENQYVFEVSVQNLNQVLCWPSTRQIGDETIQMKDAFIQLNSNGNLNLNNEVVVNNPDFSDYLGKFIFIKLKNTASNQVLQAEQVAILDC